MLLKTWNNIVNAGINHTPDLRIRRKIRLSNILASYTTLLFLAITILWFHNSDIKNGSFQLLMTLVIALVPLMNQIGLYRFSRVISIIGTGVFLFYFGLLGGREAGIQFIYIVSPVVYFAVYDYQKERKFIGLHTFILIALWLGLEFFGFDHVSHYPFSKEQLRMFYFAHTSGSIVIGFTFLIVLLNDTTNSENQLYNKQDKLEESKTKAEKTSKIKSDFLSNMSHEMRTPLNSILGFTDLIGHTSLNEDQREYLDYVQKASTNMLGLVNDILDFSKFDTSDFSLQKHSFQLENIVKEVEGLLAVSAKAKDIGFSTELNENSKLKLLGDSKRLKQIFLNVLNNAIKFTKEGHVNFIVNAINKKDNSVTLEITIIDTGIGIAQAEINQIFESFQQAKTSSSRLHEGTGLGLAIVKQLVKAMNGTIQVKSEINKGSTFILSIPFEISKAVSTSITDDSVEIPIIRASHILIVDDNEMNLILIKKLLSIYDTSLYFATSGEEALLILEKKKFDAILMDLQMPKMSGLEVHDRLLENKKYSLNHDTPYIILTADAFIDTRKKALDQGIRAFLTKPINKEELYKTLNQCLSS